MTELPLVESSARRSAGPSPHLSILVPTYDRDVRPLCGELLAEMRSLAVPGQVELLVLVDGNRSLAPQDDVIAESERLGLSAGLSNSPRNLGRSGARNALARLARGRFLLFLDADGLPDQPGFVARALANAEDPWVVVCGGRTGQRMTTAPRDAQLFERHSRLREWISADERNRDPSGTFLSANFLVSREMFLAHAFDESFEGWGWEDTEWALRIRSVARVHHVDSTVSHMEHHRDASWLAKLEGSAMNYARLYELYPEAVRRHRLFSLIRLARRLPGWCDLRGPLRALVLAHWLPAEARLSLLKILQAMQYARVLKI